MPGVPSGRGCNACRKQKKKCNITQYPCPRCSRLEILCTGLGEQRYLFKNENERLSHVENAVSQRERKESLAVRPARNLSNPTTRLTAAFVEKIGPSLDVRFHLQWNFGPYLADIPCRLGTSEALDCAAAAVVTAHARFCAGYINPDTALLAKHSRALATLRRDLDDPAKARSSETLCSIMLLMIYQSLTKATQPSSVTHSDGATQILKGRGYSGARDSFENKLLSTLRGPVVVEALMKDDLPFTQQEWSDLVTVDFNSARADSNPIKCLARIPHLLQRCRKMIRGPSLPDSIVMELKCELELLRQDCNIMVEKLRDLLNVAEASPILTRLQACTHAQCLTIYSMGLATGIITNCILSGLDEDCIELSLESSHYSNEILQSAISAAKYLPLGSFAMIIFLRIAYLGALDLDRKAQIKSLHLDYEIGCWGSRLSNLDADLTEMTGRFSLRSMKEYTSMQERHLALLQDATGFK